MSTSTPRADLGPRLLGAVGVSLLLAAAISLVSARWELFGPGARLTTLLVASAVLVALTGQIRRLAPSTAGMLDLLVAAMVPIDTAAAVIVTGGSWRTALVLAGPVTVLVGAVVRQRILPLAGELAIGAGAVLTAAGAAAQFEIHGPLVLAGVAVAASLLAATGRDRAIAAGCALVAGLTPVGRLVDEVAFTGMGTLREMGLVDERTVGVALAVGGLSLVALAVVALRDRSPAAGIAALGIAVATGLEMWAIVDPPAHVGLLAVATVLALVELVDPKRLPLPETVVDDIERANEAALVAMTALVAAGSWMQLVDEPGLVADTPLTAGVIAAAWIIGQVRRGATVWVPALPGLVVSTAAAAHLATDDPRALAVVVLVGGAIATGVRRRGSIAVALVSFALAPLPLLDTGDGAAIAIGAAIAVALTALAVRRAAPVDEVVIASGVVIISSHGLLAAGAGAFAWSLGIGVAVGAGLWWLTGGIVGRIQSAAGFVVRGLALLSPLVLLSEDPRTGVLVSLGLAVAAGLEAVRARRAGDTAAERALAVFLGFAAADLWLTTLRALDVELVDLYVVPLLWAAIGGAVRAGAERTPTHLTGLGLTAAIALGGRVEDASSVHTAILGAVAVLVAVAAGRTGDRATLSVAGPVAVAAATFDLLDRSVGVESWGWLLIGWATAVAAAIALERRDAEPVPESSVV